MIEPPMNANTREWNVEQASRLFAAGRELCRTEERGDAAVSKRDACSTLEKK